MRAEKRATRHLADIARKQQAAVVTYNAALMTPVFSPPIPRAYSSAITPTISRKRKLPAMPEVTADVLRQRQLAVDIYDAACGTMSLQ